MQNFCFSTKYKPLRGSLQDNYTFRSDYATMSRTLKEVLRCADSYP